MLHAIEWTSRFCNRCCQPCALGVVAVVGAATALFAATSALAALHKAKETGNGESIDLAQYEVMMRVQGYAPMEFLNFGVKPSREDAHNAYLAGVGCYEFADGRFVYIMLYGTAILNRVLPLLGLQFGSDLFPSNMPAIQLHTAAGQLLEEKLGEFCKRHTATEASELLLQAGAPVSVVYDYEMALHDPHYKAREVFVEWNTVESKPIKGINIFPKFKKNPGRIWRGAPYAGWTTRMSWKN